MISYDQITTAAKAKGIIPICLVFVDYRAAVTKRIMLDGASKESNWPIPHDKASFIEYTHEFTWPDTYPRIRVDHFLARGFPDRKDVVDAKFLQAMASKQNVRIKKIIISSQNKPDTELPFRKDMGEIHVPNHNLCKLVYDADGGDCDIDVRLDKLLSRATFPRSKILNLKKSDLELCIGFVDVELLAFRVT